MPGVRAIAEDPKAGRVEPTRLGGRVRQPTAGEGPGSAPLSEAPFATGGVRAGELAIEAALADAPGGARVELAVRNASSAPLRVESVVLGLVWRGHGLGSLRFLRHGWQSWSFTGSRPLDDAGEPAFPSGPWLRGLHHALGAPPADRAGWHESELVTVVGASPGGAVCLVGVLEPGEAFGVLHLRREGGDVRVEAELRLDALLEPGERRVLPPVRVALGDEAPPLLERFAEELGRAADARVASAFVTGWCSWYHFFHDVDEVALLRNVEALAEARDELPIEVVQLDDGWQRAVGDWLETNERFPSGLAAVAAAIREAGFLPGLWTAPFCVVAESRLFGAHPEWLLGPPGDPHRGLLHAQWARDGAVYVLDPGRPEVREHLRALFAGLVERGFPYLKLDFLYAAAMEAASADPSLSRASRLRRGLEAIRAGAGDEAFLLGCGCPLGAAVGIVDGMRIGPDVAPAWRADPSHAIPGIEETLPAARSSLRSTLARAFTHRRLWQNDPDCILARDDSALDDAEVRALAAAVAGTGGMALFSDDLPAVGPGRRAVLAEALAAARRVDALGVPGAARVPDLLAQELPTHSVAASAAGCTLAAFNPGDAAARASVEAPAGFGGEPELLLGEGAPERRGRLLELSLAPHDGALLYLPGLTPLAVFCDFDGTFSIQDVGATLAARHAGEKRPRMWQRYARGEINAWEYNLEVLEGMELSRLEVDRFLETIELDPGARDLVSWCEARRVPFCVLSDGFDYNLNRLQQIHGLRFAYEANHLRFEGGRWRIRARAPDSDGRCGCGTGLCKRACIRAFRESHPGVPVVHVGNGKVSDTCGALAADVVFAKDSLAEELDERGVGYERFETLHDVIPGLERLL